MVDEQLKSRKYPTSFLIGFVAPAAIFDIAIRLLLGRFNGVAEAVEYYYTHPISLMLVLILAVLLDYFNDPIHNTLAGNYWPLSLRVGASRRKYQAIASTMFSEGISRIEFSRSVRRLFETFACYELPPPTGEAETDRNLQVIGPTRLCNAMRLAGASLMREYWVDIYRIWPEFASVLSDNGYALLERKKAEISASVNLVVLSVPILVLTVAQAILRNDYRYLVLAIGILVLAKLAYEVSVWKAKVYCRHLRGNFVTNRGRLLEFLGKSKEILGTEDERRAWWELGQQS